MEYTIRALAFRLSLQKIEVFQIDVDEVNKHKQVITFHQV